jgi:hypothetical protein
MLNLLNFDFQLLVIGSFVAIIKKDCRGIPLPVDSKFRPSVVTNQSLMDDFVNHFYDSIQIYHMVIISADVVLFLLALINIAPAQEDLRFGFHLLVSFKIVKNLTKTKPHLMFEKLLIKIR